MEHKQIQLEAEILEILAKLGIPAESNATEILKTIILSAVTEAASFDLDDQYDKIGRANQITRERVRQILHKAVWNNWNVNSKDVLKNHFGADVRMNFEYVKPNHVEFIKLIADNLREKHHI